MREPNTNFAVGKQERRAGGVTDLKANFFFSMNLEIEDSPHCQNDGPWFQLADV